MWRKWLFVAAVGVLLREPLLLVHGCGPSGKGHVLCYTSWSHAGVQLWTWSKALLSARLYGADPHHKFTGNLSGHIGSLCMQELLPDVSPSVGAEGVCVRGSGPVWGSTGQSQPPPLSHPDSQHTFPASSQSSDPSASWNHRYNLLSWFSHMYNYCIFILACINMSSASAGHTVEMSCLHLLHGDPNAQTWTDITSQVSLSVTHLYAIFYITHFSWWVSVLYSHGKGFIYVLYHGVMNVYCLLLTGTGCGTPQSNVWAGWSGRSIKG